MEVENMTAEELYQLAAAKAGATDDAAPASSTRHVTVDGLEVAINEKRIKSWQAFKIVSKLNGEFNMDTAQLMFEFISYVTDCDEAAIVEHCGGEDAQLEDVVRTAAQIINECYPKN